MKSTYVLIVDDDPDILTILADNLGLDGYDVLTAGTGKEALELFLQHPVKIVILDLTLPDIDGIQICRLMRERSGVPIIMLTARDRVPDKVLGLESGADDYIVKPFDYLELSARMKACLRRQDTSNSAEFFKIGDLEINVLKNAVTKRGNSLSPTQREFTLLVLLARNRDRVVERAVIRKTLWPDGDIYKDSRAIDVHIQHLRHKLEDNPSEPKYIRTVQGLGYMLTDSFD